MSQREGNLEAPTRHALDWKNPDFYNQESLNAEMERVFDICHGCRRCVSLCGSFPTLFDLVDATEDGEVHVIVFDRAIFEVDIEIECVNHCILPLPAVRARSNSHNRNPQHFVQASTSANPGSTVWHSHAYYQTIPRQPYRASYSYIRESYYIPPSR